MILIIMFKKNKKYLLSTPKQYYFFEFGVEVVVFVCIYMMIFLTRCIYALDFTKGYLRGNECGLMMMFIL